MTARTDHATDDERPFPLIPALDPVWAGLSGLSYPLVRIATGAMLIPHGYGKLFGGGLESTAAFMASAGLQPAYPLAVYIACVEFIGGIPLVVGLLTRPAALLVAGFMFVAAFHVHWPNGFLWINRGFEYPLLWGLLALALVFGGGGRYSLDWLIGREV